MLGSPHVVRGAVARLIVVSITLATGVFGCGPQEKDGRQHRSRLEPQDRLAVFSGWQKRTDECVAIQARLRTEIVLHPDDPMDAVDRLEELSGLPFLPSSGASKAMNALPENRRYMHVLKPETTIADGVDILARALGLAWDVRDGTVLLDLEGEIDGWMIRRFYPVSDLLTVSFSTADRQPDNDHSDGVAVSVGCLLRSIRHLIEPDVWRLSSSQIEVRRGIIIVQAPGYICAEIEAYLDALREPSGG